MIVPDDRIIAVDTRPAHRLWAAGPYRASISRHNTRVYSWRVWNVIGPVTVDRGEREGREEGNSIMSGVPEKSHRIRFVIAALATPLAGID